ncbi:hypothetical protein RDI58_029580 [Solanum bulbocastanum]|uniref:Uncharacterized protein n=1 Tax=Solanum bulbocastanum TaxID=147425 RepID=A0AAN8Y022_SOLBU
MLRGTRRFHEQDIDVKNRIIVEMLRGRLCTIVILSCLVRNLLQQIGETQFTLSWLLTLLSLRNCLRHAGKL